MVLKRVMLHGPLWPEIRGLGNEEVKKTGRGEQS